MKYKNNIGSVSSGTMRTEDLIPCFLVELTRQHPLRRADRGLVASIRREIDRAEARGRLAEYWDSDQADCDLNEGLFDALDGYSPPYFYFGSHPGDGADYGWWLSDEWEQQLKDDGGIKVNGTEEIPRGFTGDAAVVNDHGNVTMYHVVRGRRYELWSLV